MYKFFLALPLLSISVSTGALAEQQRSGTPEEQAAASDDTYARKFNELRYAAALEN